MMGQVAQFLDPMDAELERRAEVAGGIENLSEGERWRLENVRRRRRIDEARAAQPRATDALGLERLEIIESWIRWLKRQWNEALPEVIGTVIGEAKHDAIAEAEKAIASLRDEINAKSDAQFDGFERAVKQLRDEDRRTLFENLREALSDAEGRIDASFLKALEAEKERNTIELALVRDELLNVIDEKTYAQFTDDAPKLKLAEKAIASLRKRMTSLEEDSARQGARNEQLAGMADQFAALEDAYHKSTKSLLIRCAANHLAAREETARADEVASKVGRLEAELERLTMALLDQKVIR
jgi:hypothetical protein